jgi:hypothetical protein
VIGPLLLSRHQWKLSQYNYTLLGHQDWQDPPSPDILLLSCHDDWNAQNYFLFSDATVCGPITGQDQNDTDIISTHIISCTSFLTSVLAMVLANFCAALSFR